jgi:hypothetical protein
VIPGQGAHLAGDHCSLPRGQDHRKVVSILPAG